MEHIMRRCFELARNGEGRVAPNPMVGAVIVCAGQIIGEGYHARYGGPHAELMAVNSVVDKSLLKKSTIYVSLEPCCHYGKTPPCAGLILETGIPRVVVAATDPNPQVNCGGIEMLRTNGVEVITGVLEDETRELNRFFYTYHEKQRPYIILKWAESADGYIDIKRSPFEKPAQISCATSKVLAHRWRSQVQSIMAGTNTILYDNPMLTARNWAGNNPIRLVIDCNGRISPDAQVFNADADTLLFVSKKQNKNYGANTTQIEADFDNIEEFILNDLYQRKVQSLFIEGGAQLINSFIRKGLWDEARIFISQNTLGDGLKAPDKPSEQIKHLSIIGFDKLLVYRRNFL